MNHDVCTEGRNAEHSFGVMVGSTAQSETKAPFHYRSESDFLVNCQHLIAPSNPIFPFLTRNRGMLSKIPDALPLSLYASIKGECWASIKFRFLIATPPVMYRPPVGRKVRAQEPVAEP